MAVIMCSSSTSVNYTPEKKEHQEEQKEEEEEWKVEICLAKNGDAKPYEITEMTRNRHSTFDLAPICRCGGFRR